MLSLIIMVFCLPFPLYAADQSGGGMKLVSTPVSLILNPYDDPSRIGPPPTVTPLGLEGFHVLADTLSATISVRYLTAGDTGKWGDDCLTWPANAQAAFNYAVNIWATQISSTVPIVIEACWTDMGSGSILGQGGGDYTLYWRAPYGYSFYPVSLANALSGSDQNGGAPEIAVAFNQNFNWYFGTTGTPGSGQVDFASVVLHEIGHGFGFGGTMTVSAGQGSWGWSGHPGIYDRFAENGSNQSLMNTGLFANPSAALGAQLVSNNIFFDGSNTDAANGGSPAKLYAPGTWVEGSSYSHLDYNTFSATPNALMVYMISYQSVRHSPGPVTLCLLKDIGWTVPATCDTIALSSYAHSFAYSGGTGSVNVINGRCCDWTAVSNNSSWLHVTSGSSGKGSGTVNYTVDANLVPTPRTGTITIAGYTYTVDQAAGVPPVAGFTYSQASSWVPSNVLFTDTSTNATSWSWDFGDGSPFSALKNPSHTYQVAGTGTYTVTLSINGGADSVSHDVTVSLSACPNPVARLVIKGISYSSLLNAYSQVVNDGETIQVQAVEQMGPFVFSGGMSVKIEGGYDCEYSVNRLFTVLKGTATIAGNGSIIMDNLIIQ